LLFWPGRFNAPALFLNPTMNPAPADANSGLSGVVVVVLVNYLDAHRRWGWLRLMQGGSGLKGTPGLLFGKVMGSGNQGGFRLRPSSSHQGIVALFDQAENALAFLNGPIVAAFRDRAQQFWSGLLSVESARGSWDGHAWLRSALPSPLPELVQAEPQPQWLAALTRASIRPAKAMSFWKQAPAAEADLRRSPGCLLAMGLGEAPLLRQCTFSVWQDTASMLTYSMNGAHKRAIEQAYAKDYFSESMFVRMRMLQHRGHWPGPQATELDPVHG
jgi:spheroidene monooxygenase